MTYRIKDWETFQHFKDRSPPWVKLYRDILDDPAWHSLDPVAAKSLVMLWLIASEDKTHHGLLPSDEKLAFRLRISEKLMKSIMSQLSHWLIQDDINPISDRYQGDAPERARVETETEGETEGEKRQSRKEEPLAPGDESPEAPKQKIFKPNGTDQTPVIERIPLIGDVEFEIHQSSVLEWERLFPAVDVPQTLKEIRAWNLANPRNRKTHSGIMRHVTQWLAKEQNKPEPQQYQRR